MDSKQTLCICTDCRYFESSGELPERCYDRYGRINAAGTLYLEQWQIVIGYGLLDIAGKWSDGYDEFSSRDCSICDALAGERFDATLIGDENA